MRVIPVVLTVQYITVKQAVQTQRFIIVIQKATCFGFMFQKYKKDIWNVESDDGRLVQPKRLAFWFTVV